MRYSRTKQDYYKWLYSKYSNKMERILITSPDCVKCHFIEPYVKKKAEEKGIPFKSISYEESGMELTSVPVLFISGEDDYSILEYDDILSYITK